MLSSRRGPTVPARWGQALAPLDNGQVAKFQRRKVRVLRLRMRGIKQTTMSSELDSGTFERAGCFLLVEVQLSVPTRLWQALEPLENGKVPQLPEAQGGRVALVDERNQADHDVIRT